MPVSSEAPAIPVRPTPLDQRTVMSVSVSQHRRISDYAWLDHLQESPEESPLWALFALSLALHATALLFFYSHPILSYRWNASPIEVDLSGSYERVPSDMRLLSKPIRKGQLNAHGRAMAEESRLGPNRVTSSYPSQRVSSSETSGTASGVQLEARQGNVAGTSEGAEVALISVTALPKLLNQENVLFNVRRFYPEAERRAGRQGRVVLDLHISATGDVTDVQVLESGGTAFDQAAVQVAHLLHFSPARMGLKPVAVQIRQTLRFQLG